MDYRMRPDAKMQKSKKYITISVAAFICYCNTLWGTFVFDDSEAIVKNKDVMPFTPLSEIFENDFWGMNISLNSSHKSYRPLTILSYRLNVIYSNMKLDAFQFHATNVILYGILCLLTIPVFELFIRKKKREKDVNEVAYLASLLFTVHPVHTEPVAGLVGRADILSSLFSLVVILLYHRVIRHRSFRLLLLVIAVVGIAVLCKETAITALGLCTAYDVFYNKRQKTSWNYVFKKQFLFRNIVLFISGVAIIFYRLKIMNFERPIFTSIDNPAAYNEHFWTKTFTYNYVYFLNFLLLLWPEWLCFDWSMGCIPLLEHICDTRFFIMLFWWCFVHYFLYVNIKITLKYGVFPTTMMAICLIVLPFLPASNVFFIVGFVIAERNLLLPSAGFCLLVALGFKKMEKSVEGRHKYNLRQFFYVTCVIFAAKTIERNLQWLSEERLFTSALNVCPLNAKVHYNVAKIAADKGNRELAFTEYRNAIRLNPDYEQAMNNLANMLREDEEYEEAESLLRKAVEVRPNFAAAWMNLGIVLTNLNKSDEAEKCYKKAIKYRDRYPDCYYNLGNLYLDKGNHVEALKSWKMAVMYRPTHVAAWSNTLVLLDTMKQYKDVIELGKTALKHNPTSPALHFSMANTLGKMQDFESAEGHFREAINLNPKNALYYSNLGVLYHRWGKKEKARDMYKKALRIDPDMTSAKVNMRKLSNSAQSSSNQSHNVSSHIPNVSKQ